MSYTPESNEPRGLPSEPIRHREVDDLEWFLRYQDARDRRKEIELLNEQLRQTGLEDNIRETENLKK